MQTYKMFEGDEDLYLEADDVIRLLEIIKISIKNRMGNGRNQDTKMFNRGLQNAYAIVEVVQENLLNVDVYVEKM